MSVTNSRLEAATPDTHADACIGSSHSLHAATCVPSLLAHRHAPVMGDLSMMRHSFIVLRSTFDATRASLPQKNSRTECPRVASNPGLGFRLPTKTRANENPRAASRARVAWIGLGYLLALRSRLILSNPCSKRLSESDSSFAIAFSKRATSSCLALPIDCFSGSSKRSFSIRRI